MGRHRNVNKPCNGCGVMMENVSPLRKYCRSCLEKRINDSKEKYREERKGVKLSRTQGAPTLNPNAKYCKGCWYWGGNSDSSDCCNYIFREGHKRPCPPGKDCTVKKTRKSESEK